jgi:hypothetical protein
MMEFGTILVSQFVAGANTQMSRISQMNEAEVNEITNHSF